MPHNKSLYDIAKSWALDRGWSEAAAAEWADAYDRHHAIQGGDGRTGNVRTAYALDMLLAKHEPRR